MLDSNVQLQGVQEAKEDESEKQPSVKEKTDDTEKLKSELEKKDAEINALKTKAETEKAKVTKKETEKMVNPETGEPLLQVGVAYKHLRDKMKKMKEDVDYLKPKLNPSQIANIKKTWQDKKPGDVTPAVKKMIKDMDIPTQLAIKHAKINQLSKLVEDLGKEDEKTIKPIIKQLKKSVKTHATQAEQLTKEIADNVEEDMDRQPQDKDVKKVKGTQPKKYYKKLDKDTKKKRAAFFKKKAGTYKKSDDDDDYKAAPGDKKAKTKTSIHTKKFKQMYGEGLLDLEEKIKGIENKAKKTGMPYGILKKVYDRGMAAWKGGHRPGATQQQWAFARVNSFVTKSSGTWGGADKDLAKKVRGSK